MNESTVPSQSVDDPYPLPDVLRSLADYAQHTLDVHNCDHHGYEGVMAAVERARQLALIEAVRREENKGG